jgi:hypothetical protein
MVRDLGVATDLRTAASVFGICANSAYTMVAAGTFPVTVIRAGSIYRVPVAAILTALEIPIIDGGTADPSVPADPSDPERRFTS